MCYPGAGAEKRSQQISPRAEEIRRFNEARKPGPECKVHCKIERQQERQCVQKGVVEKPAKRAKPAEADCKENESGYISE